MDLHRHPDLVERLASAYALGTLRGGARRRFEALARQSPRLRTAALLWQERFASMTELQPREQPAPHVWTRIENLVAAEPRPAAAAPATTLVDQVVGQLRRRVRVWRGLALGTSLASVAVAGLALVLSRTVEERDSQLARATQQREVLARENGQLASQLQARPDIQYVAVLADEKAAASVLVTFDPGRNALTLKRVAGYQEAADKSLQLWALPPGGAPRSLGVLGGGPVVRLTTAETQVREVPALAISLEPRGGAPAGSGPTGPVLFKGALLQTQV